MTSKYCLETVKYVHEIKFLSRTLVNRNPFVRKLRNTELCHRPVFYYWMKQLRFKSNNFISQSRIGIIPLLAFFWPLKRDTSQPIVNVSQTITLETKLKDADQLFDNSQYEECYNSLKILQNEYKPDVEILWRVSRTLYQLASQPNIKHAQKQKLAYEAFATISEAIELNENHFAVHKWMSVVLDLKSACEGTKQRIKNLENVKRHMLKAIEINPTDATTLYMLGEWCYRIADMPWYQREIARTVFATPPTSSYDEALSFFLKAEVAEPNFYSMNWLMLGKSYLMLGKTDAAKHYLNLALSYSARTNDDQHANREAQKILKHLK